MYSHVLRFVSLIAILTLILVGGISISAPSVLVAQGGERTLQSEEVEISPDSPDVMATPQKKNKKKRDQRMLAKQQKMREELAALEDQNPPSSEAPLPNVAVEDSNAGDYIETQFHGTPSEFFFGRNNLNTRANLNNGNTSTLAEPSAANDGPHVLASGNLRHAEYSTNGGSTWTDIPIPGGPADAPLVWGDTDVIYDEARGVAFRLQLYLNAAQTNGVMRVFVHRTIPVVNCSYTFDPAGTANNIVPDYPKLHKSNNFLYISSHLTGAGGGGGTSEIRRYNIDQMADCVAASGNVLKISPTSVGGRRVIIPVEGARERMYFATLVNASTLRIFYWDDSSSSTPGVNKTVSASSFADEDCRGGTGNNDWWNSLTANIIGYGMRGAVGAGRISFYWNVASDASHAQGHIHGAIFRESDFALLTQPVIANAGYCFGQPVVSVNDRGDVGMVLAFGGKVGGGGAAAQPAVGVDDDFTAGLGVFGACCGFNFNTTAAGTANRSDARYGDYFVIHRQTPCGLFWETTSYALNGGTSVTNVNSRYTEFGRRRDGKCYYGWRDKVRTP